MVLMLPGLFCLQTCYLALTQRAIQKARSQLKQAAQGLSSLWEWTPAILTVILILLICVSSINTQQNMELNVTFVALIYVILIE